jgi:hypothetical protein
MTERIAFLGRPGRIDGGMLWPRRVWWVALEGAGLTSRAECMGCGQLRAVTSNGYCSTCLAAQARHAGTALAVGATGVFFGIVIALGFPLLWPRAELGWHLAAAGAGSLLPLGGLRSGSRERALGGAERRVWPLAGIGAIVEHRGLAERLASESGTAPRALWLPPIAYRPRWWLLPALAIGLALLADGWHHPRLWVINLGRERLWLYVDGEREIALEPAGIDARRAMVEVRAPRGDRELSALNAEDRVVATTRARLESGREHLYAPGSAGRCFWLQVTGYGRDATESVSPLVSTSRFFSLNTEVDVWFSDTPASPPADRRSSGGTLTTLRQSPCERAPEAVRRAASAARP